MLEGFKKFPALVGATAFFVAFNAAFFSIFGLSKLFSGAFWSVVFMATSLEVGKLVTASFVYQYWNKISKLMRGYLIGAVVLLVFITSIGIFGFLSNAYQGATLNFKKESTTLLAYEERLEQLEEDKTFLKEELDAQVNDLPDNYRTARRKLREQYNPMIQDVSKKIIDMKQEMSEIEIGLVQTGVDVGPAIFVAKVFGTDVDTVVTWLIFVFIFVFDPLAVVLTIGFNIALGTQEVQMYIKEEEVKKEKKKVSPPKKKEKKVTPNRSITSRYENVHTPSSYDTLSKEEIGKDGVDVTK
tara:strand:- start:929 stop:1825 length:897 start_codon:yes stop_codon:yes gene_type:complete